MINYKYIIVTGISGFVGKNFINKLLDKKKYKYLFIYNKNKPKLNKFIGLNYSLIKLDLTKKKDYKKLPNNGVYIFYHFAANPNTFLKDNSMNEQFYTNTTMSMNIAEYCKKTEVKNLFFASSVYVYSGTNTKKKFSINDNTYPTEILGASKLSSELILKSWSNFIKTKIIILRFFTIYGKDANPNQFIPRTIKKIIKAKNSITFFSNSIERDFIHIDDVTKIISDLSSNLNKIKNNYTIFNIGNGKKIKILFVIKYLIKLIKPELKLTLIKEKKKLIGDNNHCADISELKKIINYKQSISIESGLDKFKK